MLHISVWLLSPLVCSVLGVSRAAGSVQGRLVACRLFVLTFQFDSLISPFFFLYINF